VDDQVCLAVNRRPQGPFKVLEKVMTSAPPIDPRVKGKIKAEVGIGDEKQADPLWIV
jgi:hypothetical protein